MNDVFDMNSKTLHKIQESLSNIDNRLERIENFQEIHEQTFAVFHSDILKLTRSHQQLKDMLENHIDADAQK